MASESTEQDQQQADRQRVPAGWASEAVSLLKRLGPKPWATSPEAWAQARLISDFEEAAMLAATHESPAQAGNVAEREADSLTRLVQRLNSIPYALTKDECIAVAKELRAALAAAPEAPASAPLDMLEAVQHSANEWAGMAINGLQWLRNIVEGISDPAEALKNMEKCLVHCRSVNSAPLVQAGVMLCRSAAPEAPALASAAAENGPKVTEQHRNFRNIGMEADGQVAWHAANPVQHVAPARVQPFRPDLLERDDLTLAERLSFLDEGWRKVRGRTERQMVLQMCVLSGCRAGAGFCAHCKRHITAAAQKGSAE